MGKVYRYYTLCRPPMPAASRRAHPLSARGAAARLFREINRSAWGTVDYSRQLTPEEIRDYELMPANVVQQPIEMEG